MSFCSTNEVYNDYNIHFNIVCRQTEMMHQQRMSCSGSRVIEYAVGEWRQRPPLAIKPYFGEILGQK